MKNIELVIKLPKKTIYDIKDNAMFSSCISSEILRDITNAIINGTPLPKGHGRIADIDEAIKCIKDVNGDDAIWAIGRIEWACGKRTIIEADKTESEK